MAVSIISISLIMLLILSTSALNSMYSNSALWLKRQYGLQPTSTQRSAVPLFASKPVDVSFEPSGKSIVAEQGDLIEAVAKKAGVVIPFKCKQGRCNSCEVRLNGKGEIKYSYIGIYIGVSVLLQTIS